MHEFAAMTNLAVWYSHMDVETTIKELRSDVDAVGPQAGRRQHRQGSHAATACRRSTS